MKKIKSNKKIITIILILIILVIAGVISFVLLNKQSSIPEFADIRWTRTTEADTEYISFNSDNSFSYSCACGNPVEDSDLCETYKYNKKTNEIEVKCDELDNKKIKIISYDENNLKIEINGETREFTKEK